MITSWLTGIPFTITAHAYDIFVHDPRTFPQAVARKCREAAFVIVVHRFGRNFLLSRFPGIPAEKLRVLHIGIDPAVFEPRPRSRRPDEAIHILSNGSLIEKKGHDVLVEAVARLREAGHQVMLTIIGGGGAAALRRQIACLGLEQVVVLASKVPQSQVVNMLAESDLFALASKRAANGDMDGIPTVLLEALAMEVPVVTTRLSGIPELVIEGQTGYLAEPGDAASFATALQEALAQPERAASMARRGRERVIAEFSASTNAARLLEMWKCHLHGIRLFTE
jgi:glycosyltransferase involved in cell wall biosynthesis